MKPFTAPDTTLRYASSRYICTQKTAYVRMNISLFKKELPQVTCKKS